MMAEPPSGLVGKSGISYWEFVFLSGALTAVIAMSIDIMLPALVDIGADFELSNANHSQYIITVFAISYGFSQLLFGPLSDVYGRKPVIYFGLAVFALASLLAAFSNSFGLLIALRIMQGFGAAAVRVASAAVIRDCFSGRDMARVMSFVIAALMIVPILAPALGQAILVIADWHWVFAVLGLFGCLLVVWTHLRLNETLPTTDRMKLQFEPIKNALAEIVTNKTALGYTIGATAFFAGLFSFITSIPQIVAETYGLGSSFAFFFALNAGAMAVGSLLNSTLVQKFGMRSISHAALIAYCALGMVLLLVAVLFDPNIWLFVALVASMMLNFGFIAGNFNSIAMEPLGHVAGSASAVIGGVNFAGGAFLGGIVGQLFDGTIVPMSAAFCLVGVFALGTIFVTERGRLFGSSEM